jgi:hypothetical protein
MKVNMKDGKSISVADLMEYMKKAMKADGGSYVWAWHCNIAIMAQDAGSDYYVSQDGAARFMKLAFDVDVTEFPEYKKIMSRKETDEQ